MTDTKITTDNQPHDVLRLSDLTDKERTGHNWAGDHATFIRYRGTVYCLSAFQRVGAGQSAVKGWDGFKDYGVMGHRSASTILVRYVDEGARVIVGHIGGRGSL